MSKVRIQQAVNDKNRDMIIADYNQKCNNRVIPNNVQANPTTNDDGSDKLPGDLRAAGDRNAAPSRAQQTPSDQDHLLVKTKKKKLSWESSSSAEPRSEFLVA